MPDPKATTAELGRIAWKRCPLLAAGCIPGDPNKRQLWSWQLETFALTGDASSVSRIVPYLDDKTVVLDVSRLAAVNDGMSTRACDFAYNAILDLLDRPGERFAPRIGVFSTANKPKEYARRDAMIAKLIGEIDGR